MDTVIRAQELNIAIIAQSHNPSILNPDWLIRRGIVKEEWGWSLSEPAVSTPSFSRIQYDSGVQVESHPLRVLFREGTPESLPDSTRLPEIAERYVERLPEVNYTRIGINVAFVMPTETTDMARERIMETMIRPGKWAEFQGGPTEAQAVFTFVVDKARIVLVVRPNEPVGESEEREPGIFFGSNCHRDIVGDGVEEKHGALLEIVRNWREDYDRQSSLVEDFILPELVK